MDTANAFLLQKCLHIDTFLLCNLMKGTLMHHITMALFSKPLLKLLPVFLFDISEDQDVFSSNGPPISQQLCRT